MELAQFQKLMGIIFTAIKVVPLGLLKACPLQWWINKFQLHPKLHRQVKLKVTEMCSGPMDKKADRIKGFLWGIYQQGEWW